MESLPAPTAVDVERAYIRNNEVRRMALFL